MAWQPVVMPDFLGQQARADQRTQSQLQALMGMRELDERTAYADALRANAPGLFGADPNARRSALDALLAQGGPMAAPFAAQIANQDRQDVRDRERMALEREKMAQELALGRQRLALAARTEDPASVREWQYFNSLSPEQQSQYLLMKRAQPFLNTGTEFVRPDPITGERAAAVPQDLRGREVETAVGKREGEEIAGAPQAIRTATETMRLVDAAINHPALRTSTGMLAWTQAVPGTPMFDFGTRMAQLQGRAFLEAFESLKGGGQITEVEGRKATEAIARLNTGQSASDLRGALQELRDIAREAQRRAARRIPAETRQDNPTAPALEIEERPAAPRGVPNVGAIEDGWRFMGGDPSSPSSWQRVR